MRKAIAFLAIWPLAVAFTALMVVLVGVMYWISSGRPVFVISWLAALAIPFYFVSIMWFSVVAVRECDSIRETLLRAALSGVFLYYPLIGGYLVAIAVRVAGWSPDTAAGSCSFGIIFMFVVHYAVARIAQSWPEQSPVRGRKVCRFRNARAKAARMLRGRKAEVWWAGVWLPPELAESNFCVVGAPGTGKTLTLEMFLNPLLPRIVPGSNTRALLYDAKCDLLSYLSRLRIPARQIHVLNPFDRRSVAWNMAADIDSPAVAQQVAAILIPVEEGPNRFFSDAARALLTGVFNALILNAPGAWTFRDVIVVMQDAERLHDVLTRHPVTRPLIDEYFEPRETFRNIRSTISSHMAGYQTVAALWHRARHGTSISLKEWTKSESILLLGNDDSLRAPLDAINRVIFQRLTELLLSRIDGDPGRTWVVLDELKEAGRLDALPRLLTKGRSFGVRVAIGFQDISGLQGTYGEKLASEITAMCANVSILRLNSHVTAEWAGRLIGETELRERTLSETRTLDSVSRTTSVSIVKREAVLASELLTLPLPNGKEFLGYHIVPAIGTYRAPIPYADYLTRRPEPTEQNYQPRDKSEQYLQPWDDGDERRLSGLFGPPRVAPPDVPPVPEASPVSSAPGSSLKDIKRVTRPRGW